MLLLNGAFMLLCLPFSFTSDHNAAQAIIIASAITLASGALARFLTNRSLTKELSKRDGYLIVTFGWLFMTLFGSLPYLISGYIPNVVDALFETMSGYTTTGATILTDIEALPNDLLIWRSITQYIGGMGIIVLAVAILPILGIGGMQLFGAEAPGISADKLHPRIKDTALRLWYIYVSLTVLECVLLMIGDMPFFDALNHSLTTIAIGGFSIKNESIAAYDSAYIQYVIMAFMIICATNFTLIYFGVKLRWRKIIENEEFRNYILMMGLMITIVTIALFQLRETEFEQAFRDSAFNTISILTTTGYATSDYTNWNPFLTTLFFTLMFVGGCSGSTAGGVKVARLTVLFKNSFAQLKRQMHPSAVIPVRLNGKAVPQDLTFNILAFIMLYLTIFVFSSIFMSMIGIDFLTAIGGVASALGNIGPGIGSVGPVDNYAHLPGIGKWYLSLLMLVGRLELFTVLMLFTPYFWRRY
ncbi:MAG: TrkH family potassium uptake protein [Bacteroidia bacterium]|nr:TrkH family potassium uptake protein [Bacteroidia bacterium]